MVDRESNLGVVFIHTRDFKQPAVEIIASKPNLIAIYLGCDVSFSYRWRITLKLATNLRMFS